MALNPIRFAQIVNEQFLNYQLTASPITDPDLGRQVRDTLKGTAISGSPLIKGPYVSLSKSFLFAEKDLHQMAADEKIHPALPGIATYSSLFAHQAETLIAVKSGNHCLVATGTGSGKTEAFLYPIIDHCLTLRDKNAPDGIVAIIVYPMNALAIDQLGRLRKMLAGTGITFGLYVGSTPSDDSEVSDIVQMKQGEGRNSFKEYEKKYKKHENVIITPWEDRITEKQMAEKPPRILLTNSNQLELLLTRGKDIGMFVGAPLKFLVFDEAHTYSGATGAEVSCLIRRIRAFCGKSANEVVCIGTSATVTDPEKGEESGAQFAHRFFGIDPDKVVLVTEKYQEQEWPTDMYAPGPVPGNADALLDAALDAVGDESDGSKTKAVISQLVRNGAVWGEDWRADLYDILSRSEYVRQVYHFLGKPKHLCEAVRVINENLSGRGEIDYEAAQAELLTYLILGASAEKDGNPLLRPKVHYFVKGLEGGCVVFDDKDDGGNVSARFYLSPDKASGDYPDRLPSSILPVFVCKTCGQHYYAGWYKDFNLEKGSAVGGFAEGDGVVWEPVGVEMGTRVILTDRFISELEDDEEESPATEQLKKKLDAKRTSVYMCRYCGSLHDKIADACSYEKCKREGGLISLWCITQLNKMQSCPCCGQKGGDRSGRAIEPIKPLSAVTVADVHILSQNMINSVSKELQKLIVFTDNRQDAAFQAGWMQDHARRYRLRHLIYDFLVQQNRPTSIGDIQDYLFLLFKEDKGLAMSLAPEVYGGRVIEAFGRNIDENLKYYLRIALVRELATGFKQRDSLETWGVGKVVYKDISAENNWIVDWAGKLGIDPGRLTGGIENALDSLRRNRCFHDPLAPIFSKYWHESNEEVQRGYLPFFDFPPKGIKYVRSENDKDTFVSQFRSERGVTFIQDFLGRWKPPDMKSSDWVNLLSLFIKELWEFLTETTRVLEPVTLTGAKGRALPGAAGVYQVASRALGVIPNNERFKCGTCQRIHTRTSPNDACTARFCKGQLNREEPPKDDYNIALLGMPFSMLSAQEHSAQVPAKAREQIEMDFKKKDGRTNCLVATPTLEMGIDIGDLDMILMRNVPPKPSNYWQRAGRAGRRFRMAVVFTYCRRSQHDGYFFDDPARMLDGLIETPRFNLLNEVMLRKHVHATVVSELIRLANPKYTGDTTLPTEDVEELEIVRKEVFPSFIGTYLFREGREYRTEPYDVGVLRKVIKKHFDHLQKSAKDVFATYWPEEAKKAVTGDILYQFISEMGDQMQETINRLHNRMMWAVYTKQKLAEQEKKGLLDEYEKSLRKRCEQYLEQLNQRKSNTYTLSVLAMEGFLPGYGIYDGGATAFAGRQNMLGSGKMEFELSRPASIAVREFVPGNMIYANSGRFKTVLFHFPVGEKQLDPEQYIVNIERNMLTEKRRKNEAGGYAEGESIEISGLPICDVDISYTSRISDNELNRFQLPVTIMGYRKRAHRGGEAYKLGGMVFKHIRGQEVRLVNVGPADRVKKGLTGYPICTVCGGSRSPYSSDPEMEHFKKIHKERCGKEPDSIALTADTKVDAFIFGGFQSIDDAVNFGEALRLGAGRHLEMDSEDLQILVFPEDTGAYELFLYDPMPGGSGLLSQIIENWKNITKAAAEILSSCINVCDKSCYACMRTYRNIFYHPVLDRNKAKSILGDLPGAPQLEFEIEPEAEDKMPGDPKGTNDGEDRLAQKLLKAGFPSYIRGQKKINIGKPYNTTTPDFFFEDPVKDIQVAVYLDGLSKGIHGNEERARIDRVIRQQLEAEGIVVIEIAYSDLSDPEALLLQFKRLAHALKRKDMVSTLGEKKWND